jgi:hypothetical protein
VVLGVGSRRSEEGCPRLLESAIEERWRQSGHEVTGVGLQAVEGQGASADLVVVKMRAGGGQRPAQI